MMIRGGSNYRQTVVRLNCCLLIPVTKPYMPYHHQMRPSLGALCLDTYFLCDKKKQLLVSKFSVCYIVAERKGLIKRAPLYMFYPTVAKIPKKLALTNY